MRILPLLLAPLLLAATNGRETLGQYGGWGAFRDTAPARCFAIAQPIARKPAKGEPFAAITIWPARGPNRQLHVRLSRLPKPSADTILTIGERRFVLIGQGVDAWPRDPRDDARIVAALRGAERMTASARGEGGRTFRDVYALAGASTAIDAASIGCLPQ